MIAKFGGSKSLKMTKTLTSGLRRIPIVGPLITLVVSILDPEVSNTEIVFRTKWGRWIPWNFHSHSSGWNTGG